MKGGDWETEILKAESGEGSHSAPSLWSALASHTHFAAIGFVGGLALGLVVWSGALRVSRRDLFSPSVIRRFAALSYLRGDPSLRSARLLRDYVSWEQRPTLRRRGEETLRHVEHHLD